MGFHVGFHVGKYTIIPWMRHAVKFALAVARGDRRLSSWLRCQAEVTWRSPAVGAIGVLHMGVEPKIGGKPPKWMVYHGKSY